MAILGVLFIPIMLALGLFLMALGYIGIENWLGKGWAIGALVLALGFRFTLPLTIGSYFAVVNVFDYDWWVGVLAAAPGLLFIVPSMLFTLIEASARRR